MSNFRQEKAPAEERRLGLEGSLKRDAPCGMVRGETWKSSFYEKFLELLF